VSDRRVIATERAPAAIGPYSQGIAAGGFVFTAGQIALDPRGGQLVGATAAEQIRRALANALAILEAAGCGPGDVVKATVYLVDMGEFAAVNAAYGEIFAAEPPARMVVAVAALPRDARVAVELVARVPAGR
jgi:2-iminobutanoate/2-iminopropanoate deaminase